MKHEPPAALLTAIRTFLVGNVYLSRKMGSAIPQKMVGGKKRNGGVPMDRLTDRERKSSAPSAPARAPRKIAEKLFLSVKTVEAHREHIKSKLNFKSSAELLRFAIRNSPDAQ